MKKGELIHTQSKHFLKSFEKSFTSDFSEKEEYLSHVLTGLLDTYFTRVPDAAKIYDIFTQRGDEILNDHVAFRSLSIIPLLKIFLPYGYQVQFDDPVTQTPFNFIEKRITAIWLKHPNPVFPRIFISEIRLDELSKEHATDINLRQLLHPYTHGIDDPIDTLDPQNPDEIVNYLHTRLWPTPSYEDYQKLAAVSEYLAWVIYNDFYLNHFTLSVNRLQSFQSAEKIKSIIDSYRKQKMSIPIDDGKAMDTLYHDYLKDLRDTYQSIMTTFNNFLIEEGFDLNATNGKNLNISQDKLLLQSSTKASLIESKFSDTTANIPGSYVEFAYRGLKRDSALVILDGERTFADRNPNDFRDGFEVQNANNIFESTYIRKLEQPDLERSIEDKSFKESKSRLLDFLEKYRQQHPELKIFST